MQYKISKCVVGLALSFVFFTAQAFNQVQTPPALYFPTVNTVGGNPNGNITLVEFFDYRCLYCRKMPGILNTLQQQNPNVRIVYRDYPLLGPASTLVAEAALSAQQQGKYLALHNAFLNATQPLQRDTLIQLASQQGLNTALMEHDNLSYLTQQQLRENAQLAQQLHVIGLPTCFVALTPMSTDYNTVSAYQLTSPTLADLQSAIDALKRPLKQ